MPEGWSYKPSPPRICLNEKEWPVVAIPRYLGGKMMLVVGEDGKRYQHLLWSPDTQIVGTRGEIQAQLSIRTFYPSQHQTTKQRRTQARRQLFHRLGIHADPTRDDIEFTAPRRRKRQRWHTFLEDREAEDHADVMVRQPRGMRRKTWLNLLNRLRKLNRYPPYSYPPLGPKRRWRHRFQKVGEVRLYSAPRRLIL